MDSRQLIDAQFDRAVEIVQGLPKTGPIQTGYEEKLTMYSLYKQATVGNVKSPRPGMFDMLGRAKWDAWAKHKDLDSYEAKWLYVDALLRVLRKYSDKTIARDLVQEIESYGGDPSNLVMSRSLARSPGSGSSGSTRSDHSLPRQPPPVAPANDHPDPNYPEAGLSSEEEPTDDEDEAPGPMPAPLPAYDISGRPQSALSASRYRTPIGGSLADIGAPATFHGPHGATPGPAYPSAQPHPGFETPSAFSASSPPVSHPSMPYPISYPSYAPGPPSDSLLGSSLPPSLPPSGYRGPNLHLQALPAHPGFGASLPGRPPSRAPLEAAIQGMQSHLAALAERMEVLEHHLGARSGEGGTLSPSWFGARSSGNSLSTQRGRDWDAEDVGMWTFVLNPLARAVRLFRQLLAFVARREPNRSPTLIIVRRLFLDISFVLCVLGLLRLGWRRSGVRRREVRAALVVLWRAVTGSPRQPQRMIERGV